MKAVVQRVQSARVLVEGEVVGHCGPGLVLLVAASQSDSEDSIRKFADRIMGVRIFPDQEGKMNLKLADFELASPSILPNLLVVSNFTVYGDTSQRRPSFGASAPYEKGIADYETLLKELKKLGARVSCGVFGADMVVDLQNDGPVTVIIET